MVEEINLKSGKFKAYNVDKLSFGLYGNHSLFIHKKTGNIITGFQKYKNEILSRLHQLCFWRFSFIRFDTG